MLLSFNDWNKNGFSIKKGSKSQAKDKNGIALFDSSQVKKNTMIEKDEPFDYIANAEFWAKANPNALYWQTVREPNRMISKKAGAILAKNLT